MILPEVFLENQAAFVRRRLISNDILVAHEVLHALRTRD